MNKSADGQVVKTFNIYQFNITLHHIKPRIWRRIQVPEDYSFKDLHYAIQDAMGWKDCHLHQFEMRNPKTGHKDLIAAPDPNYTYDFPLVPEDKAKILEYFLSPKDKAIYQYDLGESWTHDIVLEQILPAVTYPQCLAGKGACPEEDNDRSCHSGIDKFDPKSVKFNKRSCLGDRLCPPEDCGGVDRGNEFNTRDFDPKLIRMNNDVDSNTMIMNKTTEAPLNKRACPPTDCGGADRGNDFNPKIVRLSNDADLNSMNKATNLNNRACPPEDCGGVAKGNFNANDFDPKLTRLSNDVDLNKAREEQVEKSCNVYQFKIILHHLKSPIWRRVQVPGEYSFKELHHVIQNAMGWSNCHLHSFIMKNPKTGEEELIQVPDPAYDFCVVRNERETKIAEYFLAPQDKAVYEYDLSNSWTHDIVLEKILPVDTSITYPRCLDGRRKTPKEGPTESEQDEEQLFYPNPDEDKFDPKSVKFNKIACLGNRLCPPEDCGRVDRGHKFNAGDFDPNLIRMNNDVDSNTMNNATEAPQNKRACPPTDCEGVDRGNGFNPKKIVRLSNDARLNSINKATEATSLNKRACPPEGCRVVDDGCINFNSKDPELIRRSIAEYISKASPPEDCGKVAKGNFNAKDFDPKLTRLSNDVDLNSRNKAREEQVVKSCNVYQFKIKLHHFKPPIWRRVQVPGEYSFKELHHVIQKAMGWKNCHLHRFTMKNRKTREEELIQVLDPAYDFCVIRNEQETKIAEYFLAPQDKAIYEYDLGFSWTHDIVLEKILPVVASIAYPRCLAGRRKTPKEDPTESEQEEEELFYNPDEDKFDPKSVKFSI